MSDTLDRLSFSIATDSRAVATTASGVVVQTITIQPKPPNDALHVEARMSAQPAPAALWTTPFEFHRSPIDVVVPLTTVGLSVAAAWHIRRSFRTYIRTI